MSDGWLMKPGFLVFIPLLLVLIIAVACGEDATSTPRPTATSAPTAVPPTATPTTAAVQSTATPTSAAIQATATPTTAAMKPTATPTPVPTPTATPVVMVEAVVDRMVLAAGGPLVEGTVPWLSTSVMFYIRPMYESLLATDPTNGMEVPQLATKWEMDVDGKGWTFDLVEDVPFHDDWGEFTSADVVHMYERLTAEGSLASGATFWREAVTSAEDVVPNGDHQVKFKLTRAEPDMAIVRLGTILGNFLVQSNAQWDKVGDDGSIAHPAGTGPYSFVKHVQAEGTLFEQVKNHWRHTPDFKELSIRFVGEPATRLAMLLAEESHLTDIPVDLQDAALERGMVRTVAGNPRSPWVLWWGGLYFADPVKADPDVPWTNILVREAMNRAVDKQAILDGLFAGRGSLAPLYGFLPHKQGWNPAWADDLEEKYGYDPERAKELLVEAGYPDGFHMKINSYKEFYPALPIVFEAAAQYWEAIGLDIEILEVDYAVIRPGIRDRSLDGLMGWGTYTGGNPHELIFLSHTVGGSFSQYDHPFIEEKMTELRQTVDLAERDRIQREIGDFMYSQYVEIPLFYTPDEAIYNPSVIEEYILSGAHADFFTHLELITAVKK